VGARGGGSHAIEGDSLIFMLKRQEGSDGGEGRGCLATKHESTGGEVRKCEFSKSVPSAVSAQK
jgi:hypothetical protein